MPTKVLILMADAGFGHRAAANAIAAGLSERYGGACQPVVVNPLDDPRAPAWLRRTQTDYDKLIQTSPDLYQTGYKTSDASFPVSIAEQALIAMLYASLRDILQQQQPDVIVTTYPLYQAPLAAVFALRNHYVPLLTVVTDLATVHKIWFYEEVDLCLVPTPAVQEKALLSGLPPDKVVITGLPVNPRLGQPADRDALRAELGWRPDLKTALFVGSKRVNQLQPVVYALNHSALPLQLVLVAGGNESLMAQWQSDEWHVAAAHVYGFVSDMPKFMQAADFVVAKAGGLVVSESLAAGLPMLLVEAIPGQETGNAEYVVQGGAGEFVPEPLDALAAVYHWLDKGAALLAERAARSRALGRPDAAYRVADLAMEAAQRGPVRREHPLLGQVPLLRELVGNP